MKLWATMAAAALTLGATSNAKACVYSDMVTGWYHNYLGRAPDPCGLQQWVVLLRGGAPVDHCLGQFLSSPEYYGRYGHNPNAWVAGVYTDLYGQAPCANDLALWTQTLHRCGCRQKFLCDHFIPGFRRSQAFAPAPVQPAVPHYDPHGHGQPFEPHYQPQYRPTYRQPVPSIPARHSYRQPGFSFQIRLGR